MAREEQAIQTSEDCTDEDIIQYVLASKESASDDIDAEIEEVDESAVPSIPTYQQFLVAMQTVYSYAQSLVGTEDVLQLINKIEKICQDKTYLRDSLLQFT